MKLTAIPRPIISVVAEILSVVFTHAQLDNMFMYADAPGEPPDGSKLVKCQEWLARCNKDDKVDGYKVLGAILEDFMDRDLPEVNSWSGTEPYKEWKEKRLFLSKALAKHGFSYVTGGRILLSGTAGPSKKLDEILRDRDLTALDREFDRVVKTIESDPPSSLTAACSMVEALCRIYIDDNQLEMPREKSIKPLWHVVKKDLGFDPSRVEDQDLLKILSGLGSVVEGIGALRTHASSAHGQGRKGYNIQPRHARLAVHSAHTLVIFILESWDKKIKSLPQ